MALKDLTYWWDVHSSLMSIFLGPDMWLNSFPWLPRTPFVSNWDKKCCLVLLENHFVYLLCCNFLYCEKRNVICVAIYLSLNTSFDFQKCVPIFITKITCFPLSTYITNFHFKNSCDVSLSHENTSTWSICIMFLTNIRL